MRVARSVPGDRFGGTALKIASEGWAVARAMGSALATLLGVRSGRDESHRAPGLMLTTAATTALATLTLMPIAAYSLGSCPDGFVRSGGRCTGFASVASLPGLVDTLDQSQSVEVCKPTKSSDYRVCQDGTVSFVQPSGLPYQKADGQRYLDIGACGPTAVANILCMQCGLCHKPISWLAITGLSQGGGTSSSDLWGALNHHKLSDVKADSACPATVGYTWGIREDVLFGSPPTLKDLAYDTREWKIQNRGASPSNNRRWDFNPVMVFLNDHTGKAGHVTTVVRVDLKNQIVVHNTWGRQYRTDWRDFERLWASADYRMHFLMKPDV